MSKLDPALTNEPTIVIPEIALEPDIKGVCNIGGILEISSNPKNTDTTKTVNNKISS